MSSGLLAKGVQHHLECGGGALAARIEQMKTRKVDKVAKAHKQLEIELQKAKAGVHTKDEDEDDEEEDSEDTDEDMSDLLK